MVRSWHQCYILKVPDMIMYMEYCCACTNRSFVTVLIFSSMSSKLAKARPLQKLHRFTHATDHSRLVIISIFISELVRR